jgi:3-hydroxybutyryl-CoA dehydratase
MTLAVGSVLGPRVVESVSAEHMKLLAVVLADPNPIHLDPEAVKALGMGDRTINQGPANFGYIVDLLREAAPGAAIADLSVRLLSNVFAGDRVVAGGTVESAETRDGALRLSCAVWLDVDGAARALDGTATLILPATS